MAVHSNSQKRICNSVSPLSLTPDWFVIDYNQCWDKGRAAGTTAPDTAKQRGKEWMQGGTPILWHVLTVGGGGGWGAVLDPCPGSWRTMSQFGLSHTVHCPVTKQALPKSCALVPDYRVLKQIS